MYGVASIYHDFGGGGGHYVGGVCRAVRRWWDGTKWVDTPIDVGPFATRDDAMQFVGRSSLAGSLFVYDAHDPFGENELMHCRMCDGEGRTHEPSVGGTHTCAACRGTGRRDA